MKKINKEMLLPFLKKNLSLKKKERKEIEMGNTRQENKIISIREIVRWNIFRLLTLLIIGVFKTEKRKKSNDKKKRKKNKNRKFHSQLLKIYSHA